MSTSPLRDPSASRVLGDEAVVLGGGLAGLLAAASLAGRTTASPSWNARSSEKRLTRAKVYQRGAKRLRADDHLPVPVGMRCAPDGTVTVEGRRSNAFRSSLSTWWRSS